ncbi:hypothetical protein ACET3Z_013177 [Daucus carota]
MPVKADTVAQQDPEVEAEPEKGASDPIAVPIADTPTAQDVPDKNALPLEDKDGEWHDVHHKRKSVTSNATSSMESQVPTAVRPKATSSAASLPIFTALSRTLSKSQRKKARNSGGKASSLK